MYKIGICGNFGGGKPCFDGQTVKTQIIHMELKRFLGEREVFILDTYNWWKNPFKLLIGCVKLIKNAQNIIMLPAQNGIKIFAPLFSVLNKFYKKKLHYAVIGGWLPEFLNKNKYLISHLKRYNNIFVETKSMQNKLTLIGFNNIVILPNFKRLNILKPQELVIEHNEPYKLCTFSRVMKEKGIEDAIETVIQVNRKIQKIVYTLDIYGQVDKDYIARFDELLKTLPKYIQYKGIVEFDKTVEVLKDYFLLLFPTYYEGEGFPGTLIDAFSAGVPVLASNWKYNNDLVSENIEGYIFKVNDVEDIARKLIAIYHNPSQIITLKYNCIKKAWTYHPDMVMNDFIEKIGENKCLEF